MIIATVKINDQIIELPIISGSHGIKAIDIRSLYSKYKILTYDQGLMSTAFCKSSITFIDGDEGVLQYRNKAIEDISSEMSFLESVHFLSQMNMSIDVFVEKITNTSLAPTEVINVIKAFPKNAHPMSILVASFAALSAIYVELPNNDDYLITAVGLVSPIIAAIYRHISGVDVTKQLLETHLSYANNFLLNMFGEKQTDVAGKALETILILHADHEQNASTATVRMTSSSESHPFACLASGTAALWGKAHGGANEAVIKMLKKIDKVENIPSFLEKVKSKEEKLMGFGHRVYKNFDPRAKIIANVCQDLLDELKIDSRSLEIAKKLEEISLKDSYFIERKLYPNVDFYSGIILSALNIPTIMFTNIFALARTSGWMIQLIEGLNAEDKKIMRPRQIYYEQQNK